ncbi:hypothetical protein J2Z66_005975 [Paenibacillus eucommiae]|uniref:Peptidase M48 domain-containing protein n=1 Tax=Paenibacillus eucommiae TaxID=1355755 RepID=A0ABS4J3B7_9BACL|nr:hypothetical protein [Paenibacillus eucommiae]
MFAIRCENIRKCIQKVNEQLLKQVVAHELAHYKRKDTIWNMVGSLYFHLMIELFVCTLRLVFNRKEAADKVYLETVNGMTSFIWVFCKMNTLRISKKGITWFYRKREEQLLNGIN